MPAAKGKKYHIENIDATVLAQNQSWMDYLPEMREKYGKSLWYFLWISHQRQGYYGKRVWDLPER